MTVLVSGSEFGHSLVTRDSYNYDNQGNGSCGNFHNNIAQQHSSWFVDQEIVKGPRIYVKQLVLNTLPANILGDHIIELKTFETQIMKSKL